MQHPAGFHLVAALLLSLQHKQDSPPSAGYNANLDAAGQSDARLAQRLDENNSAFAGLSIDAAVSQMPRLQVLVVPPAAGNPASLSALLFAGQRRGCCALQILDSPSLGLRSQCMPTLCP